MKISATLLLAVLLPFLIHAQGEINIWRFGRGAGINFNTNPPSMLPLQAGFFALESCASACDPVTGGLLFYTNGQQIWDKNNNIMPATQATELGGNNSTTQCLIVPKPGDPNIFYIFTAPAGGIFGGVQSLCYSMVNLTLNNGNGDVATFSTIVMPDPTEKIAGTKTCDGQGYWVVGRQKGSNTFYASKVTAAGVSAPVISAAGMILANDDEEGSMQFSPDGSLLAFVTSYVSKTLQVLNFNTATGEVTGPVLTDIYQAPGFSAPYGCSFSPDGRLLYTTLRHSINANFASASIYQYDMAAGNEAAMLNSRTEIINTNKRTAGLQKGPDGKIYIASDNTHSVSVINNPNAPGLACNYQPDAFVFPGGPLPMNGTVYFGLPNFVSAFLPANGSNPPPGSAAFMIPDDTISICPGDTVFTTQAADIHFSIYPHTGVYVNADSTKVNFSPSGNTTYAIITTEPCSNAPDTLYMTVMIKQAPVAAFAFNPASPNTGDGNIILTNQSTHAESYQWLYEGAVVSNETNYAIPNPGEGIFCYTLVANSCSTDSTTHCITIKGKGKMMLPNAFSPNGDNLNDVFRMEGEGITLNSLDIFNRFGERVHSTNRMEDGWDGTFRSMPCDVGVYFYHVLYTDGYGSSNTLKGDVLLMR